MTRCEGLAWLCFVTEVKLDYLCAPDHYGGTADPLWCDIHNGTIVWGDAYRSGIAMITDEHVAEATRIEPINNGRILISILNWNSLEDTKKCLTEIASTSTNVWDIIVIDNGSVIDPSDQIALYYPNVECVVLPKNRSFAGGQNFAMQFAIDRGYDAAFLLNNDCEISPAAIEELVKEMRGDPLIAAVSPLIYCSENRGKPQIVDAWFDWANHRSVRPSLPNTLRPIGMPVAMAGTALLLRCATLKEIGLFDERYFAYYEDNDLSARIAKAGWSACYCQTAVAWHSSRQVAAYSDMALYLSARNAWLFWRTHTPTQFKRGMYRHLLTQSLNEITSLKKAGAGTKTAAVVAGFWDAQLNRFGKPPETFYSPRWLRKIMVSAPFLLYRILSEPKTAFRSILKSLRR